MHETRLQLSGRPARNQGSVRDNRQDGVGQEVGRVRPRSRKWLCPELVFPGARGHFAASRAEARRDALGQLHGRLLEGTRQTGLFLRPQLVFASLSNPVRLQCLAAALGAERRTRRPEGGR